MYILDFKKKYNRVFNTQEKDWSKDWASLLNTSKETRKLKLCFYNLLEEGFSFEHLKSIIDYDEQGRKEIFEDENTFKWACAFGHPYLIHYLNDKVKTHNIAGAITATFLQYRLDNLQTLELLGYEKEIYTEPNLCMAISRANQWNCGLNIVDYFLNRLDKFPRLSNYVWEQLIKEDWVNKILEGEYTKTFEILLNAPEIKEQVVDKTEEIMERSLIKGNILILDQIMSSHIKEDFVAQFAKTKKTILSESLCTDTLKDNATSYIIEKYPQLLKHEDIKLWMMNSRSLNIQEFILEKRKITNYEIKKSFLLLSREEATCSRLIALYPDFNYKQFKIPEAIKIVNNIYEFKRYNEIDYSYDGEYMIFNRKILLNNKEFNEFKDEIKTVIYDEKMFDLLYREQVKINLESKLKNKDIVEKKLKI